MSYHSPGPWPTPTSEGLPPLARNQLAVQEVARSILRHRSAARLPSIVEYQERLGVGSGTVQKAFHILEESGAATTEPRGHLGRFVVSINPGRAWSLAGLGIVHAVLTPPGALEIYGLVDGLLDEFGRLGLPLQVNYQRGSMKRLERIASSDASFAVMSSGAAASLARDDLNVASLAAGTYYSPGSLVRLSKGAKSVGRGSRRRPLRVGIDRDSSDHVQLTEAEFGHLEDVCYVDCQFPKVPADILAGRIDVGIWHRIMLLVPLKLMGIAAEPISPVTKALLGTRSAASIVFPKDNLELGTALDYVNLVRVAEVQEARLAGIGAEELAESSWSY